MSGGWSNPWGGGGGVATNISTSNPQPPGTPAPGSTGEVSDAGHQHRHSYLSELNAWGVPSGWNANTNSPALASGIANATNTAFVVTTAGSTTLDGITSWVVGDVAYFDGASATWKKLTADAFEPSTWAARGTGTYVGQKKWITDVGGPAGAVFSWDGYYWRPVQGGLCIRQRWGTVASPLATYTGGTGALFTLPSGGDIAFPAGLVAPNSHVEARIRVKRTGANATANMEFYLGTAGTASDPVAGRVALNATDGHVGSMLSQAFVGSDRAKYVANGTASPQNSTAASSFTDKTTGINWDAAMIGSIGMASANAADSFALIGYAIYLFG